MVEWAVHRATCRWFKISNTSPIVCHLILNNLLNVVCPKRISRAWAIRWAHTFAVWWNAIWVSGSIKLLVKLFYNSNNCNSISISNGFVLFFQFDFIFSHLRRVCGHRFGSSTPDDHQFNSIKPKWCTYGTDNSNECRILWGYWSDWPCGHLHE